MNPVFTKQQKKRLRIQYFAAETLAGSLRFARTCLALTRTGYCISDFFEQEGLDGLYQEMLDDALSAHYKVKSGHLYLAVNPMYSTGLHKVGATRKAPEDRMKSLVTSGIPGQFSLVKAWGVPDVFAAEAHCARVMSKRRIQREFYEGNFTELTSAIDGVVTKEWQLACSLSHFFENLNNRSFH